MQFDSGEKQIKGRPFHAECDMCRRRERTQGCNQALHLLLLWNNPDPSATHAIVNRSIASLYVTVFGRVSGAPVRSRRFTGLQWELLVSQEAIGHCEEFMERLRRR